MRDALLRRYPLAWACPIGWGEVTIPELVLAGAQTAVLNEDGTLNPAMNIFPIYAGE